MKRHAGLADARRRVRNGPDIKDVLPHFDCGGPHHVGYRVVLAAKYFDRCVARILAEHSDLTLPQWRVLAQLGLLDDGTVRSLASGGAVDRSETSRAVRELEAMGLVVRRENPNDLRSPLFSLTTKGRTIRMRVREPVIEFMSRLVEQCDPTDLEATDRVMWAMTSGCLAQD